MCVCVCVCVSVCVRVCVCVCGCVCVYGKNNPASMASISNEPATPEGVGGGGSSRETSGKPRRVCYERAKNGPNPMASITSDP